MRNLRVVGSITSKASLELHGKSVFSVGDNGSLFVVTGAKAQVQNDCTQNSNGECSIEELVHLIRFSDLGHEEIPADMQLLKNVLLIQFIGATGSLYLGTREGKFLQLCSYRKEIEELFQSQCEFSTFSVSPDSRFLAILTSTGVLLLLTLPNLDLVLEEVVFDSTKYMNIQVQLCWRHDSQYFVLNVPDEQTGRRLKFYTESGKLFSTTEDSTFLLCEIIAWEPAGGLIAAIEKPIGAKIGGVISFYELNGLKRSSFNPYDGLPIDSVESDPIVQLCWNISSDLLALRKKSCVEFWHRSNYVWMNKGFVQTHVKGSDSVSYEIIFFAWDQENHYKAHIILQSGTYIFYEFAMSFTTGFSNGSALAVGINGRNLYVTPFRDNSAPPPYGYYQATVESYIKEVVIPQFWDGFLSVLYNGKIFIFENKPSELTNIQYVTLEPNVDISNSRCWIWPSFNTLCCINEGCLLVLELSDDLLQTSTTLRLTNSVDMNFTALQVINPNTSLESEQIFAYSEDGSVVVLDLPIIRNQTLPLCKISSDSIRDLKCVCVPRISADATKLTKDNFMILALNRITRRLEVFWQDLPPFKLATDCTSLSTFCDYLLFTTIQGSLEIIHLNEVEKALTLFANGQRYQFSQYSRKAEKGSIILTCCSNILLEPTVVLQVIPRGNIETIHPRPLVIDSIKSLLRHKPKISFSVIMKALRRHRIEANILIDELKNFEKESGGVFTLEGGLRSMVKEVKDSALLVLFVTELNQEHLVCANILRSALEDYIKLPEGKNNIQPYLAVMARLGLYEDVLNSELIIKEQDREVVKSRIKFLSFYTDNADTLYEAAIGTYDLGLTAIVCDCLNKDPKEYLPILNHLRSLPLLQRHFAIDTTLKRWIRGLKSVLEDPSTEIQEIKKYVQKHRLFTNALQILPTLYDTRTTDCIENLKKIILDAYGEYLETHGKCVEASVMYKRAGNVAKAIECSVNGGSWESAILVEYSDSICRELLSKLRQKKDWEGAARLASTYLGQFDLAIEFLVNARKWISAHALTAKDVSLQHMAASTIIPRLVEHQESLSESLNAKLEDIRHYIKRYKFVVEANEARKSQGEEVGDNFSDTESILSTSSLRSTNFSTGTGRSHRSGKNKRKLERKLYSLKEGSRFEDIGIAVHLWETITIVQNENKIDVATTIESLWHFDLDEIAAQLTELFDLVISELDEVVKEIWKVPLITENPSLESKYRISPPNWTNVWNKLSFLPPQSR